MTKQIVKFDEYELRARVFPAVIVTLRCSDGLCVYS